jgi:hypothetical protein
MKDDAVEYASENPEKAFLIGAIFTLEMKSWMSHKNERRR